MFVLAHLSDPHLAPLPSPHCSELAGKRVLGFLNWHRSRRAIHRTDVLERLVADLKASAPDHIAVTGDLVNISLDQEFASARAWLGGLGAPPNVTLVPGNHDVYVRAAERAPAIHWGDYMQSDERGSAAFARRISFPFVRRRGPVALVGLSTALPTAPFMATGLVGSDQLQRLGDVLAALEREGLFRVVLIHHPPAGTRASHKRLVDAAEFRRVIAEHGAELVIHGHDHVHALDWIDGPRGRIPVVGVPSASAVAHGQDDAAAYNLYRIEGGPGAWRCEVVSRGRANGHDSVTELSRRRIVG
jgi:3',5'-cyclic AMP phosphodiesterase CpdA